MTEICLVRHGQTDWNFQEIIQGREDIPLNEIGRTQARQSAEFLKKQKWDMVISSPLGRAHETAKMIAEAVEIDSILLDERFIERNFGEVSGKSVPEFRQAIANGAVEGMETEEEMVKRCFDALKDVVKKHEHKRIIIVAHSHAIKAILHGISPSEITFLTPLHNACSSFVTWTNNEWEVVEFNVSDHIFNEIM